MHNFNKKFRLGLYEKAMPTELDWETKIISAKELGFDFLEISIDETDDRLDRLDWSDEKIYALRDLCQKHGVPFQSICLSAHRKYPFGSENRETREKAYIIMQKAINFAYKLGVRCIQLAGYDVYYEEQNCVTHQNFIDGMKASAKMAERAGIMLGVEIMDTPYLNSLSKFEVLKREIPSPYFMAYPDVGNISGWNHDVYTELKLSRDHLIQIHLKDTLKVSSSCKGQFRDLVIGDGEVDFETIFTALNEINYRAPLVIEMWAQDENWKSNIKLAKERLVLIASKVGFDLDGPES